MTSAPRDCIEATLTGLAPTGTQMIACVPKSLAAYATDWPWFPVDAAISPARSSCSGSCETRLTPPRTLNAPVGRSFSCLTQTSAPTSSENDVYEHSSVGGKYL